ncbi:MAG: type II secretion system F family protein [Methylacidiphilales bacterium]|nr:type II secretion system F family protein [Candidatus Methylacidiphilales bacterium]
MKQSTIASFYIDFAHSLQAGYSIQDCLENHRSDQRPAVQMLYAQIQQGLSEGHSIIEALQTIQSIKPVEKILIGSSEGSGHLAQVLLALGYMKLQLVKLKQTAILSALYPALVVCISVVAMVVLKYSLSPVLQATALQNTINLDTVIIVALISVLILTASLYLVVIRNDRYKDYVYKTILKIPLIKNLYRAVLATQYLTFLSCILEQHVALSRALGIVRTIIPIQDMRHTLGQFELHLQDGATLAQAFARVHTQAQLLLHVQIISIANAFERGDYHKTIERSATMQRESLLMTIALTNELITPILMLLSAGLVLGMAYSLLVPLLSTQLIL